MNINILAGGPLDYLPELTHYHGEDSVWVGVDRGVLSLLNKGIEPVVAFGDFDSVTESELKFIKSRVKHVHTYTPEKDEPDMELALNWAIEQGPKTIRIFAGTGGRLDHFFANIQLLMKPAIQNEHVEIIDKQNVIFIKKPGTHILHKKKEKKFISFIPLKGSVSGLTLTGFKYPLQDRHIPHHSTLCISNELIDDFGTFSFTKGILMVIRSSD